MSPTTTPIAACLMYDELFANWEKPLKFQIGGRDVPDDADGNP